LETADPHTTGAYGACLDLLNNVDTVLERKGDAITDNPIVFPNTNEILTGGNFHAEPIAFAADITVLAICEIGALSERRVALLVGTSLTGMPPFLTSNPGANYDFMAGKIATGALVAENKQKAHPAPIHSAPTVPNFEDRAQEPHTGHNALWT
jgi:histidine ammonia-lyase